MGIWPLESWDCGFESHLWPEGLFILSVVCCQVEGSARTDPSSKEVLPSLVCVSVMEKHPRKDLDPLGLSSNHEKKEKKNKHM